MTSGGFTRTVNPLQFEALEPKRFEDLVRQLLYDFRPWRQLEATGRLGSDDGFDARGWEVVDTNIVDATDEDAEEQATPTSGDRIWLVQCKREREIGPKKLRGYLEAITSEELVGLHGIIVAACADFSKRTRDQFHLWCVEHGVREHILWGKAELEDALFQPKNDHFLFAYFGLSLTIRRRSDQARLRAQTTTKRKLKRAIAEKFELLLRDAADTDYPFCEEHDNRFRWWIFRQPKLSFRGLELLSRRYFAYIDNDGTGWDYANVLDDAKLHRRQDPWRGTDEPAEGRSELLEFWDALPIENRAWLDVFGVLPFAHVLEVDEVGDDITSHVHVYVTPFEGICTPFQYEHPVLETAGMWDVRGAEANPSTRIERFPAKFRKPMRLVRRSDA